MASGFTLSTTTFVVFTFANLAPRAHQHHSGIWINLKRSIQRIEKHWYRLCGDIGCVYTQMYTHTYWKDIKKSFKTRLINFKEVDINRSSTNREPEICVCVINEKGWLMFYVYSLIIISIFVMNTFSVCWVEVRFVSKNTLTDILLLSYTCKSTCIIVLEIENPRL